MISLFILWLTVSSCTFVDAKIWEHREEVVQADSHGTTRHVKERICDDHDQACLAERAKALKLEAESHMTAKDKIHHDKAGVVYDVPEGRMAHAAHTVKDKINEAVHHIKGESEELHHTHKREILHAKDQAGHAYDKASDKASHAYDRASDKASHAKDQAGHAYDRASDKASHTYDRASDKASAAYDKAKAKGEEAGSAASHAFHQAKEKILEATDSVIEGTKHAGDKVKHATDEAFDSTSANFRHAGHKMKSGAEDTSSSFQRAGEKMKHAAEGAFDSTASSFKMAKDRVQDLSSSAYDQASAKAGHLKDRVWGYTEVPFMHWHFPGFHAWMGIFTAVAAQLTLGWLWYGLLFRKPFLQALQEDRLINVNAFQTYGLTEKFGHFVKDSAVAAKISDAAHRMSHTAAGQKISQTGEFVREKVNAGTASMQNAAYNLKDRAEASAYNMKDKAEAAAYNMKDKAEATAYQAGEKIRDSQLGQKAAQTAQNIRDSDTAQNLTQTAYDAKDRLSNARAEATAYSDATTATQQDYPVGAYSVMWGPISSVFTGFLRSFLMFHWLKVLMVHSYWSAILMAALFFFGSQFCSMQHYIWEGRPLKMLLLDQGCELALNLTTALIVFHGLAH